MQEQLKWSKFWCERIFIKVAARIGVPLDDFIKDMYKATVTGDWKVHGDEAVQRKWATDVVERMNENSFTTAGATPAPAPLPLTGFGDTNPATGRARQEIAPAGPCDLWWMYDPTIEYVIR